MTSLWRHRRPIGRRAGNTDRGQGHSRPNADARRQTWSRVRSSRPRVEPGVSGADLKISEALLMRALKDSSSMIVLDVVDEFLRGEGVQVHAPSVASVFDAAWRCTADRRTSGIRSSARRGRPPRTVRCCRSGWWRVWRADRPWCRSAAATSEIITLFGNARFSAFLNLQITLYSESSRKASMNFWAKTGGQRADHRPERHHYHAARFVAHEFVDVLRQSLTGRRFDGQSSDVDQVRHGRRRVVEDDVARRQKQNRSAEQVRHRREPSVFLIPLQILRDARPVEVHRDADVRHRVDESLLEAHLIRVGEQLRRNERWQVGDPDERRLNVVGVRDPRHADGVRNEEAVRKKDDVVDDGHVELESAETLEEGVVLFQQATSTLLDDRPGELQWCSSAANKNDLFTTYCMQVTN